jgi:lysozyme family protein
MAAANYAECLRRLLLSEGGFVNDPRDPGGATNFGITLADARAYWKRTATADDVRLMPRGVACEIYRLKYWDALNCDFLPPGVDYSVFDYGVNSGTIRSGKVLRRVLALPIDDWQVTPEVLAKVKTLHAASVVTAINNERMAFLMALKTWTHFGNGWSARVKSVRAYSEQLAHAFESEPPKPHVTPAGVVMAKAYPKDNHPIECMPIVRYA